MAHGGKRLEHKNDRYEEPQRRRHSSSSRKHGGEHRRLKKVLLIVLIVVLAIILAAVVAVYAVLGRLNHVDRSSVASSSSTSSIASDEDVDPNASDTVDPNSITWSGVNALSSDHVYNILLIGQDRREGESTQRSDSMILCSINTETGKLHLVSFLRDMYVQIPGHTDNRINAAYAYGGMSLLDETIQQNFGITVDGNVEVDFDEFKTIIDIFGGVDIELSSAEASYVNAEVGSSLTKGTNHLNGEEALSYARCRHLDSDFGRTERQRTVLLALAGKMKSLNIVEVGKLVNEVLPNVTTDLSSTSILSYATKVLPIIGDSSNISTGSIPQVGEYSSQTIRGMAVLVPDLKTANEYLASELYGISSGDSSSTACALPSTASDSLDLLRIAA